MNVTLIVCGGRAYWSVANVFLRLDSFHVSHGIARILEGGAMGADRCAREWAKFRDVPYSTYEADWSLGGRAGPIRNQQMIDDGNPGAVMAFPGNKGTADMVRRAKAAGILVYEF